MRHLLLIVLLLARCAFADELATPKGEVLLTISGNIEFTNSDRGAEFDLEMLEQLGQISFTTETPWTDASTLFEGVNLGVLLDAVGARSSTFRAIALDNYWYDISGFDFDEYPVIVAYKRDGEFMSARTLGPLWIMYPFSDFPELLTHENKAASVWQLHSMVVQ